MRQKRWFRDLTPSPDEGDVLPRGPEGIEQQGRSDLSGSSGEDRIAETDQRGEVVGHNEGRRVLDVRGDIVRDEVMVAGETMVGQEVNGSDAKLETTDQGGIKIQFDGSGISGGDSDTRVGAANQGGEIGELDESGRALGIRGENACDEALAAGDLVAGETGATQGTSGDGDGGGVAAAWATMSRRQRKAWLRGRT